MMQLKWWELLYHASQLSLGVSQVIEDKMYQLLGEPQRGPTGEPVPNKNNRIPQFNDYPLLDVEEGQKATISWVKTRKPEEMKYFFEVGLLLEETVEVRRILPFDGPYVLIVNGSEVLLSRQLTEHIFVLSAQV